MKTEEDDQFGDPRMSEDDETAREMRDSERDEESKDPSQPNAATMSAEDQLMNAERIFGKLVTDKLNYILEDKIKILKKESIDGGLDDGEDVGRPFVNAV